MGGPSGLKRRLGLLACMVFASLTTVAGPAVAADQIAFRDPGLAGTNTAILDMTGLGGSFAWIRESFESSERQLAARVGGGVRTAPVDALEDSLQGPLDLGPGPRVVYSRCPERPSGRCDADLVVRNLRTFRERRVRGASSPRRNETVGAIWGRRVAYSRRGAGRDGIFLARSRRRLSRGLASELDLRGRRVAWISRDHKTLYTKRFSRRGRGRVCLVARAGSGHGFGSLTLGRDHVFWARGPVSAVSTDPVELRRRRLPSRRCGSRGPSQVGRRLDHLAYPPQLINTIALDGDRAFYYAGSDEVREMTDPPLTWR